VTVPRKWAKSTPPSATKKALTTKAISRSRAMSMPEASRDLVLPRAAQQQAAPPLLIEGGGGQRHHRAQQGRPEADELRQADQGAAPAGHRSSSGHDMDDHQHGEGGHGQRDAAQPDEGMPMSQAMKRQSPRP